MEGAATGEFAAQTARTEQPGADKQHALSHRCLAVHTSASKAPTVRRLPLPPPPPLPHNPPLFTRLHPPPAPPPSL